MHRPRFWCLRVTQYVKIIPALRKIEKLVSVSTPAEDPDLGMAETVIDMEAESLITRPA